MVDHKRVRSIPNTLTLLIVLALVLGGTMAPAQSARAATPITFTGEELLGRPTDTSITIKIVPDESIAYYYEYATSPGTYSEQPPTAEAVGGEPSEIIITGLSPNTQHYYRMQYHPLHDDEWVPRAERSFWTQRAQGEGFVFTITADSHVNIMLGNAATWTSTLNNVAADSPDFHIDLGDTFAVYTAVGVGDVAGAENAYTYQLPFFNIVSHSASVFLMAGNHEQTEGWHRTETTNVADSLPALSINAMKKFYLNPVPDEFYTGNTDTFAYIDGDQTLGNYYAWEWGDALFVVIDPFWYTETRPYTGGGGGGEGSTGSQDRWDWTLGQGQFNWLKETLEGSDAPFKFIFAHHMVGGSDDYVRGGAVPAHLFEWGGYHLNGTTWGFDTQRPGWGPDPIHQIMVQNGVSAFFHGHDHQYAYEMRDGIVYQSMPSAYNGSFNYYNESNEYTIKVLPSPGHLRVTVNPDETTVEYIATSGGAVNHSYTIEPNAPGEGILGDVNGDGNVSVTDALIILSGDVGNDISQFCPVNCGDVSDDGMVTAIDALIILSYDVGLSIPYAGVGLPGCPASVTPPSGCSP